MFFMGNFYSFYIYIVIIMCFSVLETFSAIHGRYTRDIEEYELSIPHRVTSEGEFVSFSIPQYFKHNFRDRHKRDTTPKEHKLYYNVIFDGKEHAVELWPNHGFISPNIITEDYNHNVPVHERVLRRMDRNKLCHYSGRVKGQKQSSAALSVCHGLAGYLTTDNGHYYIEPMAEHGPNENGEHVHIVHKRRLHDKADSFGYPGFSTPRCGVTEKWEDAWNRELLRKAREDMRRGGRDAKSQLHSLHRYVELLLVIDKKFLDFHRKTGTEQYIMTIMNMVYNYYHDQSVGNIIDVTVVRIIYLNKTNEHLDLSVTETGETTLDSLCAWAQKINPKDISNPNHHDIAVLFTRYDLCSQTSGCGLLGLAYLGSACNPSRAGVINEDTGLALGTTVTHEVGHSLGCNHDDGSTTTPCTGEIEDSKGNFYIMAPYSHLTTTRWSSCSRKYISSLFESGLGDCLNDEPADSLYHDANNMPPGAVYDADFQCGSYFANYEKCNPSTGKFCDRLFCKPNVGKSKQCRSNGYPPADGTKCGENKWCFARKCVEMGQMPEAIDGGWGEWGPWGDCTRECGGGLQTMERDCTNPAPMNKGRYCIGERKRQKMCNTQPCEGSQPTFREKQCMSFNNKPFKDKLYTWKPYSYPGALCQLICINNDNAYVNLAPRVIDGTSCKPGSKDKCIGGACQKVGCDNVIGSNAVEDICGVCNGDATNCKITKTTFTGPGASGYTKVATIPAGVRHFRVTEAAASVNTLAIATPDGSHYYLNGDYYEKPNGDYDFGGVIGIYDHPTEKKETLFIPGPLKKPLALYEVFYSPTNPGLEYEYSESRPAGLKSRPSYIWEFEEFEGCSARCGQGVKKAVPSCTEKSQGRVSDKFCDLAIKPEPKTMECFVRECKFKWRPTGWGSCTGCKNKPGTKERTVDCVLESAQEGKDPIINEDKYCTEAKPSTQQMCCSDEPCPTKRAYNEADMRIADLWHQLDYIKTKHNLYEKEKEAMLAKTKNAEPGFEQIVRQLSGDEMNRQHLVERYLGDLTKYPTKLVMESITPSFQPLKRNSRFQKRDNDSDECVPTASVKNDTAAAQANGSFIQDTIQPEGQEVFEVPIKLNAEDVHLSDEAFEAAGDSVADTLDFCNVKTYKGKEADEVIAEAKNNAETTTVPTIKN